MCDFKFKEELVIILTTEADFIKAKELAVRILEKKYAACISFNKIKSFYWWNGVLENSDEIQLIIKTKKQNLNKINEFILNNHSYKNPELIFWKVNGSQRYGQWIDKETRGVY